MNAFSFALCLLCLVGGLAAAEEVYPPLKVPPNAPLAADFAVQHHAWAKRVLLAPLAQSVEGNPQGPAVLAYADKYVNDLASRSMEFDSAKVGAEGAQLLQEGCMDPLVAYLAARSQYRVTHNEKATAVIFRRLIGQLEADRTYGRALLCFIGKDLASITNYVHYPEKGIRERIAGWTAEALADGSYGPEDDLVLADHLLGPQWHAAWEADSAGLTKAVGASTAPEWIRKTLQGALEERVAYDERGGDWTRRTHDQERKDFAKHLEHARAALTAAWTLRPQRPYAAARMIPVVMGGGGGKDEDVRLWFDRAIAAQLDYKPAYDSLLTAYRPRWGGSVETMLAFGQACREAKRYDTEMADEFWSATARALEEVDDIPAFLRSHPRLLQELAGHWRDCLAQARNTSRRQFCSAMIVCTTWLQGDYAAARKAAAGLTKGLSAADWQLEIFQTAPDEILADLALHGTKAGEEGQKAETAYQGGFLAAAATDFESAIAACTEEAGRQWLTGRLAVVNFERELAKGDWVKLVPHPGSAEWLSVLGHWQVAEEMVVGVGEGFNSQVVYRGRVGKEFEVRGEFQLASPSNSARALGVVVSYQPGSADSWYACTTWQRERSRVAATLFRNFDSSSEDAPNKGVQLKDWNHFEIRSEGGVLNWKLNGQQILKDYRPKEEPLGEAENQIGFSGHPMARGNTARIRNLEVRRLPAP